MMFFVLAITALFVAISVYFFFRAEKLQRFVLTQKRDSAATKKENKGLVDSMALIAGRYEEFAKNRLVQLKERAQIQQNDQLIQYCELISPLINNYTIIFRECLKGKGRLKGIAQKCFDNHDPKDFKQFVSFLMKGEKNMKRLWASNNLNGYICLVEALLVLHEKDHTPTMPANELKRKQVLLKEAANNS